MAGEQPVADEGQPVMDGPGVFLNRREPISRAIRSTGQSSGPAAAMMTMLPPLHDDSPHLARVAAAQQLLFPASPRALCDEMGLNWWAALKLNEDGWLSFSPEKTAQLDESQEAELRFIGSLVIGGCDRNMLNILLSGLAKPYAYDVRRLFFDWSARRWRLLPDLHSDAEATFADWLEVLVSNGDVGSLLGIGELAQDALSRVRHPASEQEPHPKPWSVTSDGEAVQG